MQTTADSPAGDSKGRGWRKPPPPLPTRLPQVSTNGNGSHSAGDQRKQNTEAAAGGPLWGRRPRNEAGPRGPALPSSPAAALTRSGFSPVAPARTPEPAENGSGAGSTCSVSPGTPGSGTTTPSRLCETDTLGYGGSRGTEPSGRRLSPRRFLSDQWDLVRKKMKGSKGKQVLTEIVCLLFRYFEFSSRITMILQRLFRLSSVIQSAVSVSLRRNIGVTAVAFNKELDPVQKLFVDKIREYRTKRQTSGGPVDAGPEYQQDLDRELFKLKQMYGKADMNTFPNFTFEDPKFEAVEKPQS